MSVAAKSIAGADPRPGSLPVESAILALEDAFSALIARTILALHPATFSNFERLSDIQ